MSAGSVVFSLDFELGWGHRWTRPSYVDQLRLNDDLYSRIEEMIALFERHEVPATWAVVGRLVEPGDDPVFHAASLFESLLDSAPAHDIGLHSYEHKPYNELKPRTVREDLRRGHNALEEWGCSPEEFIFPQNKISHAEILTEQGIYCYRGGKRDLRSSFPEGLLTPETFRNKSNRSKPVKVPASMYLAARRPSLYRRWYALRGLRKAIRHGEMIHYWLHPHNVVTDPTLFSELELLLEQVSSAEDAGNVKIRTVTQTANGYLSK